MIEFDMISKTFSNILKELSHNILSKSPYSFDFFLTESMILPKP